jgi:hypothetical protein
MQQNPFTAVIEKSTAQKGKYIDAKAWGVSETKGVSYDATMASSLTPTKPTDKKSSPNNSGGSLDDVKIPVAKANPINNTGSVIDAPATKPVVAKPIDNTGSVANEVKKEAKKEIKKETEKGSTEQ